MQDLISEKQSLETKEEYITDFDTDILEEKTSFSQKIESFLDSRYFVGVVVVLVAVISFCIGRFVKNDSDREPVRIIRDNQSAIAGQAGVGQGSSGTGTAENTSTSGQANLRASDTEGNATQVVASKNGTKYHLPTCPGAKQISEKNKITFNSIEEARAAGYTPAANCKGLK